MKTQRFLWLTACAAVFWLGCGSGGGNTSNPACTPNCWNKECGDDGCGGSCGVCNTGQTCQNGQCVQSTCTECDPLQKPMVHDSYCQEVKCDLTTCQWKVVNKPDGLACTLIGGKAGHCINGACGQCNHNGQCEDDAGENCRNCQADCGPCCGNGECDEDYQENCSTCPKDCACQSGQVCYNNTCCTPKTCLDLGWQCGSGNNGCGGQISCGQCNAGQSCRAHKCVASQTCGDGYCDSTEGENCGSCPQDCGCSGDDVCFKNECCTPKKCYELGWDCGSGDNGCGGQVDCGNCQGGDTCQQHKCVAANQCGDGNCDTAHGESCSTCPKDCGKCMDKNCSSDQECQSGDCFDMSQYALPNPVGIGFCSQDCTSSPCPAGFVCWGDGSFKQCLKSCQSRNDCDSKQDCLGKCFGINGVIGPDTYIIHVSVQATGSWDAAGGQPDFEITLTSGDGTVIGSDGPNNDSMTANFQITVPNFYNTKVLMTLDDADITSNDYIWDDKDITAYFVDAYMFGSLDFKPFTYTKPDKSASATVTMSIEKK